MHYLLVNLFQAVASQQNSRVH